MLEDLKLDPGYDGFLFLAESSRNPPSLRPHHHAELELNLVADGTVTYVVGGKRITYERRSLLWLFPAQEHQLVDRTKSARYYVAVFTPGLISRACVGSIYRDLKRKRAPGGNVVHTVLVPESFDFLRRTMDWMMQGSLDSDVLNREAGFGVGSEFRYRHADPGGLNAGLRHLLLLSWRLQRSGRADQRPVALHPSVSKAISRLADDTWEGSLGELARECGLSEAHFSRLFRAQVGVPLNRYRNSLRLGRFWENLRGRTRPTIMEAAFAAGFGSYAQFYKIFRDAYGESPRSSLRGQ